MALASVAALAFAAGRYLGQDAADQPPLLSIQTFTPTGPESSLPLPPATVTSGGQQIPGTLREIMQLRGDFLQTTALYVLASSKDRTGIEQLLNEAASIQQVSERSAATSILYGRYAELDPEAAIDHIKRRGADFEPGWLYSVFHTWARSDLEGAVAHAVSMDDSSRVTGGTAILRARDDLRSSERERIAGQLGIPVPDSSALDVRTPEAAERSWRAALASDDYNSRLSRLQSLAYAWGRQDPRAAMRAIESLQDRSLREQALMQALSAWAEKEPREAAEWALARPPAPERVPLLALTLGSLVTSEPTVALGLAEGLSNAERQQVVPQILANWANIDARSAAAWVENLDGAQSRRNALMSIAGTYAMRHPDEAFRWAASLSGTDSHLVMSMVIGQIAASDPVRAAGLVNRIGDEPQRDHATLAIVQNWSQRDPQAALAWVEKLPASDMRPDMYNSIFQQWAAYDADTAIGELSRIDDTGNRNTAILGMLGSQYLEPDMANRLYQRIEGAEARRQAAMQLYYNLKESDPRAADRYRIEAGMPEDSGEHQTIIVN